MNAVITHGQSPPQPPQHTHEASDAKSGLAALKPDMESFRRHVQSFFRDHCIACHGETKQKAGLRLDNIDTDFRKTTVATRWTEIMDRLNAGEMPPEEKPRPDVDQLTDVTGWIVKELRRREAAIQSTGGRVVLRRLNRAEYLNTVRDLLGYDLVMPNDIPADPPAFGFDNIGAALSLSPLQMEKYVQSASDVLDQVIPSNNPLPPPVKWRFQMDNIYNEGLDKTKVYHRTYVHPTNWHGKPQRVKLMHNYEPSFPFPRRHQGMLTMTPRTSYVGVQSFQFPKAEGEYLLRVRAAAMIPSRDDVIKTALARLDQYAPNRHDVDEMRNHFRTSLDYQFGPPRIRLSESGGRRRVLAEFDVAAPVSKPKVYEIRCRFNGASNGISIANNYARPQNRAVNVANGRTFPRPLLFIDSVELEGPIVQQKPSKAQLDLLGAADENLERRAQAVLKRFLPRAWRRPVSDDEIQAMVDLFNQRRATDQPFEEAIKVPLTAVLASPHFLYMVEAPPQSKDGDHATISNHELASRLSYFLWSTMPDKELFDLAEQGKLSNQATLEAQVDRMLAHKRSNQFVTNFAGQWLGMRKVGTNPPSRELYPRYDDHLQESMVRETLGFFHEILRKDLDVMNFIKSDFVTINERLARHYHIEGVKGDHIRRVAAPPESQRGGLLTQGSIHAITSNGTRTSPVMRGTWILERLLGDPPPPPPPDAGEIPQRGGAGRLTVRQRLEHHRQLPACAACHDKIDPLGFAMEQFRADGSLVMREATATGSWARDTDPIIDTSAQMPDGRRFKGVAELQEILLKDEGKFLRHLATKLATYALGRGMEFSDRRWIATMVSRMKNDQRTLRGLIKQIVTSEQFQRN